MTTLFLACQEEENVVPELDSGTKNALMNPDDAGFQIAKKLSLSLNDVEVREFIKTQAVKKFDGDYDVLIAKVQNESISSSSARGTRTFGDILAGSNPNARSKSLDLDKILAKNPLLQIAVPELPESSAETWDTERHTPVVVYRDPAVDLNTVTNLPAFDSEGNAFYFDISQVPTEPIIVVSFNERLTAIPKGKSLRQSAMACPIEEPYFSDENFNYYYTSELYCYPTDPDLPDDDDNGGSVGCDRDNSNSKDHIKKLRFTSMEYFRAAESYVDGNPEVYFVVTFGAKEPSGFSTLRKYIPSTDRSHWKDCGVFDCDPEWYDHTRNGMPMPVFDWDPGFYGDRVRYDWFEEDFSTTKTEYTAGLTVSFKEGDTSGTISGQGKWTINDKDKILGQDITKYCDKANYGGSYYTTGQIEWYVGH